MVSKELLVAYERLNTRLELHQKATRRGNFISKLGVIIAFLSVFPVIPLVLQECFEINFSYSFLGGVLFGLFLIGIGQKINQKSSVPPKLSVEEKRFLKLLRR